MTLKSFDNVVKLEDHGVEVDLVWGDSREDRLVYFHTEEACRAAAQLILDKREAAGKPRRTPRTPSGVAWKSISNEANATLRGVEILPFVRTHPRVGQREKRKSDNGKNG